MTRPSDEDVAALAGCSPVTVWRVRTGAHVGSVKTRAAIEAAVRRLGGGPGEFLAPLPAGHTVDRRSTLPRHSLPGDGPRSAVNRNNNAKNRLKEFASRYGWGEGDMLAWLEEHYSVEEGPWKLLYVFSEDWARREQVAARLRKEIKTNPKNAVASR